MYVCTSFLIAEMNVDAATLLTSQRQRSENQTNPHFALNSAPLWLVQCSSSIQKREFLWKWLCFTVQIRPVLLSKLYLSQLHSLVPSVGASLLLPCQAAASLSVFEEWSFHHVCPQVKTQVLSLTNLCVLSALHKMNGLGVRNGCSDL